MRNYSKGIALGLLAVFLPLCALAARDFGADVSHFQGETGISQASWNQMFTEGKRFVFIKATEGFSVIDSSAPTNAARATAAGLRAGVYHFAHPDTHPTTNGAIQEADYFLINAGNLIGPGYLRPVLDLEVGSGLSTADLTAWVIAFQNEIISNRGAAAAPIIYTAIGFANAKLDSRMTNYDLWIRVVGSGADPSTATPPGTPYPTSYGSFGQWAFWQYDDSGSSGGISPLDLNVCHSEYKTLDSFLIPSNATPHIPAIATQPSGRTIRVGNSASFTVTPTVNSSTPLSYQWQFQGTNIGGATASTYSRTNAQLTSSGNYTVILTNSAGSITSTIAVLSVLKPPPPVPGAILYQENFDEYGSESAVTTTGTANGFNIFFSAQSGATDFTARFGYNYGAVSSPTPIPSAPHSTGGTKKGLSLTANKDGTGAPAAVNLYPTGQNFSGTFSLKFDMWINFPNTGTATEHAIFGIDFSGTNANRIGQIGSDGLMFTVDGDGGFSSGSTTVRDFGIYRGAGPAAIPTLVTSGFGPQPPLGANFDNADAGFAALFPAKVLSFTTPVGSAGNGWVSVEVRQVTNQISWFLNDTLIAEYANPTAYTNGNLMIGYNDASASTGSASDNFAVIDNLRVETVPDVDGNGMADAWELQYFGQTGIDPDADADGDGVSNLIEYQTGMNPTNSASYFHLTSVTKTNSDVRLDWATSGGHTYVVQMTTNLITSTNFIDLSPPIVVAGNIEGTTNYVHVGGATNQARFYRIRLGP